MYNRMGFAERKSAILSERLKMGWATPENKSDAYSEFCYNDDPCSPNHIMKIRGKTDGI